MRPLGIPTVLDRFVQQAVMQVLQADWDGTFSEMSFGFRPGRSARQAVEQAQAYIASGHGFVVDIDLEKFFDRVNHDILMGLVAKRVATPRRRPGPGGSNRRQPTWSLGSRTAPRSPWLCQTASLAHSPDFRRGTTARIICRTASRSGTG